LNPKQRNSLIIIILAFICAGLAVTKLPLILGLDLQGGARLILEAKDSEERKVDQDALLGVQAVIRNRVDGLGVAEAIIQTKGTHQIVVELPGIKDPDRAINIIGQTARLEFSKAEWAPQGVQNLPKDKFNKLYGNSGTLSEMEVIDQNGNVSSVQPIILQGKTLDGSKLKGAYPATDQNTGEPVVSFEFNKQGAQEFANLTRESQGKQIAILLDGKVISAPNVNVVIADGRGQISGGFSVQEMKDLVIKLKAGALPVPVEIVSNKTVGPTLGQDSIEKSKQAGIIGLALILAFMLLVYRVSGFFAGLALISYCILTLACFKVVGATLTLPGIAGFILTMGMAVDANVIIFERIKEERASGVPLLTAIESGFKRAFKTILDANVTTLIAAIVLFWLGTGPIKGFAVTLSIGILVSMFSAITITQFFIGLISRSKTNIIFKG